METRENLTTSDGIELAYWRGLAPRQPAPTLVLLHGAASNHTRWSELLENTALTDSWDTLRPDLRGNGASMFRGRLDREIWSRDLVEILDADGIEEPVVVGHSLGAQIALDFATRYPKRARGLALIDPVFRGALIGGRRRLARLAPLLRLLVLGLRGLNALGLHRRTIDARRDLRELDEETRRALAGGESHAEIAQRYSALGPILRHMPVANYLQQLIETSAEVPKLEHLELPVLVLASAGVSFADPEINRREIERFPNARTVVIDANHWPLTERPDAVRETLEEWVRSSFVRGGPSNAASTAPPV
jgi:pimeloyl-ACP methyl ester carboxylesterase